MKHPLAYITAPWSENEFENTENAAKYCRAVYNLFCIAVLRSGSPACAQIMAGGAAK